MEAPSPLRRAATEFAAITAGVLVALAIDAAWQTRLDRIAGEDYLQAAVDEIRANAGIIRFTIEGAENALGELERARRIAEAGLVADSAEAFLAGLVSATGFTPTPLVTRSVVEDLVGTGSLRLIRDAEVRRMILAADVWTVEAIDRLETARATLAPGLARLMARHVPPGLVIQGEARPRGRGAPYGVSTAPELRASIRAAAGRIAADPAFLEELNVEFRRLELARGQCANLRSNLEWRLERFEGAARGGDAPD